MADSGWKVPAAVQTAFSTDLNAVADASFTLSAAAIDNENDLNTFINLEVLLASFTPGAGSPYVAIYMVPSIDDGSNYGKTPDGSSGDQLPIAIFPLEASVAQATRLNVDNIPIPPLQFKLCFENQAGATLAATGNTVRYRLHKGSVA